jgi:hypothetical protein
MDFSFLLVISRIKVSLLTKFLLLPSTFIDVLDKHGEGKEKVLIDVGDFEVEMDGISN